ncbi:MAG: shikimate kinase, partial [Verrucomicrobiota bacterium]
ARELGLEFADTDDRIVEEAGMKIPAIFAGEGESGFRRRETLALSALQSVNRYVLATGGGLVLKLENRELPRSMGVVVWLTADVPSLLARIGGGEDRPLMKTDDQEAKLVKLLEIRSPLYEEVSDLKIETTDLSLDETVYGLIESLHYQFPGLFE